MSTTPGPEGRPFPTVVWGGARGPGGVDGPGNGDLGHVGPWRWEGPGGLALAQTEVPPRAEGRSRLYLVAHRPSSNTKVRLVWPPPRALARAPL